MPEIERVRTQAWASILTQPEAFPAQARRDALYLARQNVGLEARARAGRDGCREARAAVAALRCAGARQDGSLPGLGGAAREWLACIEEMLAIAERSCALASVAPASAA
jgi:hypothetical protein